jgi:hypothetical protein
VSFVCTLSPVEDRLEKKHNLETSPGILLGDLALFELNKKEQRKIRFFSFTGMKARNKQKRFGVKSDIDLIDRNDGSSPTRRLKSKSEGQHKHHSASSKGSANHIKLFFQIELFLRV